jgi:hypothetical protein
MLTGLPSGQAAMAAGVQIVKVTPIAQSKEFISRRFMLSSFF